MLAYHAAERLYFAPYCLPINSTAGIMDATAVAPQCAEAHICDTTVSVQHSTDLPTCCTYRASCCKSARSRVCNPLSLPFVWSIANTHYAERSPPHPERGRFQSPLHPLGRRPRLAARPFSAGSRGLWVWGACDQTRRRLRPAGGGRLEPGVWRSCGRQQTPRTLNTRRLTLSGPRRQSPDSPRRS